NKEPKQGQRVRVAIGADEVIGRVFRSQSDAALAQLRLERPVAAALGQALIVRNYSPPNVLGGGKVEVPQALPRKTREAPKPIQAKDDAEAILIILSDTPTGVKTEEICRRLGKTPQALGSVFEALREKEAIHGFAGTWLAQAGYEELKDMLLRALTRVHERHSSSTTVS